MRSEINKDTFTFKIAANGNAYDMLHGEAELNYKLESDYVKNFTRSMTNMDVLVWGVDPLKVKALMSAMYSNPERFEQKHLQNVKYQESTPIEAELARNLVALDRDGVRIYEVLTQEGIGLENDEWTFVQIQKLLKDAIVYYYSVNDHKGCTDPDSLNYNSTANHDDNSCDKNRTLLSMGGIFQNCEIHCQGGLERCGRVQDIQYLTKRRFWYEDTAEFAFAKCFYEFKNPVTKRADCPEGYDGVWVRDYIAPPKEQVTHHILQSNGDTKEYKIGPLQEFYKTWYCRPKGTTRTKIPLDYAMNFGGAFRFGALNEFASNIRGCPNGYEELVLGKQPDGLHICYTLVFNRYVDFGGLYTCRRWYDEKKTSDPPSCKEWGAHYYTYITGNPNDSKDCEYYCVFPRILHEFQAANLIRPPYE